MSGGRKEKPVFTFGTTEYCFQGLLVLVVALCTGHFKRYYYDCGSCLFAVLLSFAFFGLWHFEGVKLGTVICALCNGWIIGKISGALERRFAFRDSWPLRKYFA